MFVYNHVFIDGGRLQLSSSQNLVNPLTATLKPRSNGPLYGNTVIGTLAVDGWAVTFGTARRNWAGFGLAKSLLAVPM